MEYSYQLEMKRERVCSRFEENGVAIDRNAIEIVSASPYEYRARMDFLWWYDGSFGLRQKGKWFSAVNLEECRLLPKPAMQAALEVNRRVQESGLPFRDSKRQTPGLRYLVIRSGIFTGDIQLSFVSDAMEIPSSLWEGIEGVTSVYQLLNENLENDLSDGEAIHLWGEPFYRERIEGREFFVGPRSFFQPNPVVASRMVEHVRQIVSSFSSRNGLIDLYCGIGLFAILLSDCFENVIGIENNQESVALAKRNAGDLPVLFGCLDAEKWSWPSRSKYDAVLVDPPRTGLHASVIPLLKNDPFSNLIYVSCNPSRGVEDIAQLLEAYDLVSVKLFDQFPQTVHVEMIAHLCKKSR